MSQMYLKPSKILEQLKLVMGILITVEDPISRAPITLSYENLHALLVIDIEQLVLEGQVVANMYAEMARFQRAVEWAADRAESRYAVWKSGKVDEFKSKHARAAPPAEEPAADDAAGKKKKAPAAPKATVADAEGYYRSHADYEKMSLEGKRLRAIAGLFEDLKWGFKMKSEQMRDANKTVGGYGATDRDGDVASGNEPGERGPTDRLGEYTSFAQEAASLSHQSGAAAAMTELLSRNPPTPTPPPTRTGTPPA